MLLLLPILFALGSPGGFKTQGQEAQPAAPSRPIDRPKPVWRFESAGGGCGLGLCFADPRERERYPSVLASAFGSDCWNGVRLLSGKQGEPVFELGATPGQLEFGYALERVPDFDGDGMADLLVGVRGSTSAEQALGQLLLLSARDGRVLKAIQPGTGALLFGSALALVGDLDGDGVPELAVGAPGEDRARGAVYLLKLPQGTVLERLAGTREGDRFGECLAALGDVNADGIPDFAIGAPGDSGRGVGTGSVRVLSGATLRALRTLFGDDPGGEFGASLALCADRSGDGRPELVVGQPSANLDREPDRGRVLVYSIQTGKELDRLQGRQSGDFYGQGLLGGFDWDQDGKPDFAVGVPWGTPEGRAERSGLVEIHSGADGSLLAQLDGGKQDQLFGYRLSLSEDQRWLAVAAPGRPPLRPGVSEPLSEGAEDQSRASKGRAAKTPKTSVSLYSLPKR